MSLSEPSMSGGLLDFVKSPEGQGLLSAAFGGLAGARRGTPINNIGRAGGAGLLGYANAQDRITKDGESLLARQVREAQLQKLQQEQQQQVKQGEWLDSINPQNRAFAGGEGPTVANAAKVNPQQQLMWGAAKSGAITTADYFKAMQPKELPFGKVDPKDYTSDSVQAFAAANGDYTKLVPMRKKEVVNGQAVDLYSAPEGKVFDQRDPNKAFNLVDGQAVPNTPFQNYEVGRARAGASNVSVNTGQKGLDNTLKLRGDFRSEPIYKAHQEVQSAYSQIVQSLDQASPAGDLAGATKFMKILDPGSVVRESELGMAMAASGAMDRLQNYTTNVMNGTKLTPTQRADFKKLATSLFDESAKQYNVKRGEYQGIAERNGLNIPDVLGAGAVERKPAAMSTLPPANSSNRGRRIRDTETGKELVSNGMAWTEAK